MPELLITITEKMESRRYEAGVSAERVYTIFGTAAEDEAMEALQDEAPTTHQGIRRRSTSVEPVSVDSEKPETSIWRGTATYANNASNAGDDTDHPTGYGFDTSGGSQHITQARSHVQSYAPSGATAPDHKAAIGVANGSVQGVDITVPKHVYREAHFIAASNLTAAYRGTLYALTGTVNNEAFRGHDAGECLFLGASGDWTDDDDGCMVTFTFASSPNETDLTVGDITGIAKKGWEYMWIEYEQAEDSTAKKLVAKPIAVHIEQVYRSANFEGLGI